MKRFFLSLAFVIGCLAALPAFGLLYSVATAPEAQAGARRPPALDHSNQPVSEADRNSLMPQMFAFQACIGDAKMTELRRAGAMWDVEADMNTAIAAAHNSNAPVFWDYKAKFEARLATLKAANGCR